ncbi:MAG TPA: hypothetical protein VM734_01735 [Kofleriaceae bacterium]|nr:hypothetical protein [Kofleriaceae bacterium]
MLAPIDMRFEVLWRKAAGGDDVPIVSWEHHFEPNADNPNRAQSHDFRGDGARVGPNATGDQLIFRYTGLTQGTIPMAWIPNGEGERAMGRIPYLALP